MSGFAAYEKNQHVLPFHAHFATICLGVAFLKD
jgi:hypothetical protein